MLAPNVEAVPETNRKTRIAQKIFWEVPKTC